MSGQSQRVIIRRLPTATIRRLPKRNGCYPIVIEGELDMYGSHQFREKLAEILHREDSDFGPGDKIVIHTESGEFVSEDGRSFLSAGLECIDAIGLAAMITAFKSARKRDGTICLIISDPKIKRIFAITGLDKVFDIFDDSKAAYQMAMA